MKRREPRSALLWDLLACGILASLSLFAAAVYNGASLR